MTKALERLEAFHADLFRSSDAELKHSIEKVVNAFKTGLFTALCDIQDFYDQVLLNDRISFAQKVVEARRFADKWDASGPNLMGRSLRPLNPVSYSRPVSAFGGSNIGPGTQLIDTAPLAEYDYIEVVIDASRSGLGFSISGGADREDNEVRVTNISPGGAVAADGRVRTGDVIVQVNDVDVTYVPHQRAVQALNDAGSLVRLMLKRERPSRSLSQTQLIDRLPDIRPAHRSRSLHQLPVQTTPAVVTQPLRPSSRLSYGTPQVAPINENPRVEFLRKTDGLGFNIVGGEAGEPIFISSVVPGGAADLAGTVYRGDVLLRVNNVNLIGATHSAAAMTLKAIPPHSLVELHLQYRPRESSIFFQKVQRASQQHLNQIR